jgi:predicted RNA-binding protein
MCMAKLYEGKEAAKPILEDIAYMMIDGDRVEVETLFGEKKVFRGKVREIDFLKSRVQLERD